MRQWNDAELLAAYANRQSEEAFGVLVERYVALVHSAARRQVQNPHLAEEVTQAAFTILAQKARGLNQRTVLSGWLCRTAHFVARNALKAEFRRQYREKEALMQSLVNEPEDDVWQQFAPLLDEAVARLNEADRNAVVLRFYEKKPLNEVGAILGIDADAAQKRVSRALEKLRKSFAKRGVNSTTSAIAENISAHSVQAAPAALAKTVTAVALAKGAAASTSTLTLIKGALKIMAWTKTQTAIVAVTGIVFVAVTTTVAIRTFHSSELSYDGKDLNEWLEQSKNAIFIDASDTQTDRRRKDKELQMTYDAVQHIGPRSIPTLVNWVANTTNGGGYILAAGCIQRLGPAAKAAVPGLITILGSTNEMARYAAFNVLQRIGPAASEALPVILDHIEHDPSGTMRSFAVTTLANNGIGKDNPGVVVPVLIECLASTNKVINRPDTLRALSGLGASAKTAIPAILPYLNDPDPAVRKAAADAIRQIEPQAATKQ